MRQVIKIVVTFLLVCFSVTARAQVITLICGEGRITGFTIDVDLNNTTVSYAMANPRTVRAEITSRFISWDSPYDQFSWRLDRATGYLSQYAPRGGWINTDFKCKRAGGDILRD